MHPSAHTRTHVLTDPRPFPPLLPHLPSPLMARLATRAQHRGVAWIPMRRETPEGRVKQAVENQTLPEAKMPRALHIDDHKQPLTPHGTSQQITRDNSWEWLRPPPPRIGTLLAVAFVPSCFPRRTRNQPNTPSDPPGPRPSSVPRLNFAPNPPIPARARASC